ncbi:hypothetical protein GCM10022255_094850 [Dactylosporangium darangshiense]|uniref:Uncharacterized protein n=1 Tax=Dactylosporangium darangshiense TaxID=579108 RepID=A0ABP8DQ47_9ACTN
MPLVAVGTEATQFDAEQDLPGPERVASAAALRCDDVDLRAAADVSQVAGPVVHDQEFRTHVRSCVELPGNLTR